MQQAIFEHQGSAGGWIWAKLVSARLGSFAMEACTTPCHSVGPKSFSSRCLPAATYWVQSGQVQVAGAAWSPTLLVCARCCQSLAKVLLFKNKNLHDAHQFFTAL